MSESHITERELKILEIIHRNKETIRQRNLSQLVGLSLGVTNSILKRLSKKGLLKIRKVNNRNIHYVVSAEGLDALARKSYRYIKHTIRNVMLYKEAIEKLIENIGAEGYAGVVLVGVSDIDFIIENSCVKYGLTFSRSKSLSPGDNVFFIYGEDYDLRESNAVNRRKGNVVYLREILLKSTG